MSRLAVGDPMNAQGDVGCRGQIVSPEKMVEWCRILRHCLTIYIGGPYKGFQDGNICRVERVFSENLIGS